MNSSSDPNVTPAWHDRYRELQNRHDMLAEAGGTLPPAEEEELRQLQDRLMQMAGVAGTGQSVASTVLSGGSTNVATAVLQGNPLASSQRSVEDLIADITADRDARRAGLSHDVLSRMSPEAVENIARQMGINTQQPPSAPEGGTTPHSSSGSSSHQTTPAAPPVAGGGAGVPPPPLPPGTIAGDDPDEYHDRVLGLLTDIRDAITALSEEGGFRASRDDSDLPDSARAGKGFWAQLRSLIDGTLFSGNPTTNIGRFARSARSFGGKAWSRGRALLGLSQRTAGRGPSGASGAASGGSAAAAGRAGGAAAGATSAEAGVAAEMGTAGAAAGSAATGIGMVVAAGIIFTAAVAEFAKAAYEFARSQEDEIRRLGQVGGAQAGAVAQLDAERIKRDVETAGETADSSVVLIDKLNTFEEKLRPLESALTNIQNLVGGVLLESATSIVEMATPVVAAANAAVEWFTDQKIEHELPEPMWDVMERMVKEQEKNEDPKWPVGPARTSEI